MNQTNFDIDCYYLYQVSSSIFYYGMVYLLLYTLFLRRIARAMFRCFRPLPPQALLPRLLRCSNCCRNTACSRRLAAGPVYTPFCRRRLHDLHLRNCRGAPLRTICGRWRSACRHFVNWQHKVVVCNAEHGRFEH